MLKHFKIRSTPALAFFVHPQRVDEKRQRSSHVQPTSSHHSCAGAGRDALLTMSLFANARAADDSEDARSVTLQYLSQDLETPQGASILYRRIRAAATRVCSPLESRALDRKALWDQCFNNAVANAVAAVHSETLSAYHGSTPVAGSNRESKSRYPSRPRASARSMNSNGVRLAAKTKSSSGRRRTAVPPRLETRFEGCRSAAFVYLLRSPSICTLRARPKRLALP